MVLIKDNFAINQNWRAARAVFIAEWSQRPFPDLLSTQVITEDADAAKKDEQMSAVAGGSGRGRAADRMSLFHPGRNQRASPELSARFLIECYGGELV